MEFPNQEGQPEAVQAGYQLHVEVQEQASSPPSFPCRARIIEVEAMEVKTKHFKTTVQLSATAVKRHFVLMANNVGINDKR